MTQEDLDQKINSLKKEFEVKNLVLSKLGTIKHSVLSIDTKDPFISCDIDNLQDLKSIISAMPPINKTTEIGSKSDSYHTILKTPYKLTLKNPASPNSYNGFEVRIEYKTEDFKMWITLPQSFVNDFCKRVTRNPTDSERHYFVGVSNESYRKLTVSCYTWEGFNNCINWYGGDKTLTDSLKVKEIMKFLLKK